MEPNKQGDAASSKPTADLEARLHATRLGDPSPPPLNPLQELAAPVERPPPRMPQSPPKEVSPTATPNMLQSQPEVLCYGSVEISPADRIRSRTREWVRNTAPAASAPDPSVAPKRSELNARAEEFHPMSLQSSSTPSFSASQGQTSASARRSLTPEEYRDLQRFRELVPGDVGFAGLSARLVRLLKGGCDCEVVRRNVLDGVKGALHFVMGSPEWSDVFVELLSEGSFDELQVILDVARESAVPLTRVADGDNECGVKSLKELINAVKQHPLLRQDLVNMLLNARLFHHSSGPDLLRSIFSTFPYEDSSVVIDQALLTFRGVFLFMFEKDAMLECFAVAQRADLQRFEELILRKTVEFAKGSISNQFLQEVLERGRYQLKLNITQRVLDNLVSLSMDKFGSLVVQACFVRTGLARLDLLELVLARFQGLPRGELERLVRNIFAANQVVRKLLLAGKDHFLDDTRALARRIETLQAAGLDLNDEFVSATVGKVMQAVREVLCNLDATPDAPNPSVAPKRSEPSVSPEEYHPSSQSHPSVVRSSSTPSFSASQGESQTSSSGPPSSTLEKDDKARLLQLLKDEYKVVRKGMFDFAGVQDALHFVMRSRNWADVFGLLLHTESFEKQLRVIVHVACESGASLMSVADTEDGVKSLDKLFKAVEQHPNLQELIINCLLDEGLLRHGRGPALLRRIFSTFHDENSSAVIRRALGTYTDVLTSKFGPECMVQCLALAKEPDLQDLEELILRNTVEFAKGTYTFSNRFLQRVLECGSDQLKVKITQSVVQNLVSLSMDRTGAFVVQACFVRTGSARPQLLQRVLAGFQGLSLEELDRLVLDSFAAKHVVRELLLTGKAHSLDETRALARTIQKLPAAGLDLMVAVREVLP